MPLRFFYQNLNLISLKIHWQFDCKRSLRSSLECFSKKFWRTCKTTTEFFFNFYYEFLSKIFQKFLSRIYFWSLFNLREFCWKCLEYLFWNLVKINVENTLDISPEFNCFKVFLKNNKKLPLYLPKQPKDRITGHILA